jgi:hypothetical protein
MSCVVAINGPVDSAARSAIQQDHQAALASNKRHGHMLIDCNYDVHCQETVI